ncbi:MAG: tetraacyldisaccharide 4'-kinase [Parabacteroides sp.]|nr:tetraacyldisaccharide 4'-kinase [Parabacteroides sp.]
MLSDFSFHPELRPLSLLYGWGVRMRDQLFQWGWLSSESYPVPVICIGNLAVGGTGKTPHTEYLIRLLAPTYRVAVLSRGYKRKSQGFLLATTAHTSSEIGDEPFQIKQKFPEVMVAVDGNRRRGMQQLLNLPLAERPQVVLLDDAFQHRYVSPSLSILLTDQRRPYYSDQLLPYGQLREPREAARRADIVIVTKCSREMQPLTYRIIEENLHLQAHQQLFFSQIVYEELHPLFPEQAPDLRLDQLGGSHEAALVVGIANPGPFLQAIAQHCEQAYPLIFADHHDFQPADFQRIQAQLDKLNDPEAPLITTEKDAARLRHHPLLPEGWKKRLYYLPIRIGFQQQRGPEFDQIIQQHIQLFYEQQNRNCHLG